jgi:hypothetical protein
MMKHCIFFALSRVALQQHIAWFMNNHRKRGIMGKYHATLAGTLLTFLFSPHVIFIDIFVISLVL